MLDLKHFFWLQTKKEIFLIFSLSNVKAYLNIKEKHCTHLHIENNLAVKVCNIHYTIMYRVHTHM